MPPNSLGLIQENHPIVQVFIRFIIYGASLNYEMGRPGGVTCCLKESGYDP